MAATREYFEDNTLNVQNGNTTEKVLIPTHLAEYGSTTGQIATKFKLDIVLPHHAGFLGGIKVSGSSNLAYHNTHNKNIDGTANNKGDNTSNPNRLSKLRIYKDGTEYALFNDGGVNRKPNGDTFALSEVKSGPWALIWKGNMGRIAFVIDSPKFANTTAQYTLQGNTSNLLKTGEITVEPNINRTWTSIIDGTKFTEGETITGSLTLTNNEGTYSVPLSTYCRDEVNLPMLVDFYQVNSGLVDLTTRKTSDVLMFTAQASRLTSVEEGKDNSYQIYVYTDWKMNEALSTSPNTPEYGWYDLMQGDGYLYQVISGQVRNKIKFKSISGGDSVVGKVILKPVVVNDKIAIQVLNNNTTGDILVQYIYYYNSTTDNSQASQYVNVTITGGTEAGTIIQTLFDVMDYPYAACVISGTNTNIVTPRTMLLKDDFGDQITPQ